MNACPWDIGLVTSPDFADLHPEDTPLREALRALGYSSGPVQWGSHLPEDRPRRALLVRSTWDYHRHPESFANWLGGFTAEAELRVFNSPSLMLWNMHKRYLTELGQRGVSVVPTVVLTRAQNDVQAPFEGQVVVKPAIGASAEGARVGLWDELLPHARRLLERGDVVVQPYFSDVEYYGERSLVLVDGRFTHAVRRTLAIVEGSGWDRVMPRVEPSEEEMEVAHSALATLDELPLYARVDLVPNRDGYPCVLELEVIEPRLFLLECPEAAVALAEGVHRRLATVTPERV